MTETSPFHLKLADSLVLAQFIHGTEIEVTHPLPAKLAIKHCIFDHDGTLSVLREGWEKIMESVMLSAILGQEEGAAGDTVVEQIRDFVRKLIDDTTGVQTLAQMKALVDLVRQFGFVPESGILDARVYKEIFNLRILELVRVRVEKLERGELRPSDFHIRNAGMMLRELYARGIKLYLVSGTNQADLGAEASLMGYGDLFEDRIFGSIGDINIEPKRAVLERIVRENHLEGHELATFGDGPAEIRETRRLGGLCIGVASDEVCCFGLNLSKRKRLIRAGADLIIPDYCQATWLLEVLQLN